MTEDLPATPVDGPHEPGAAIPPAEDLLAVPDIPHEFGATASRIGYSDENRRAGLAQMLEVDGRRAGGPTGRCWYIVGWSLGARPPFDLAPNGRAGQQQAEESLGLYRVPAITFSGLSHVFSSVAGSTSPEAGLTGTPTGYYGPEQPYTPESVADAIRITFGVEAQTPDGFAGLLVSGEATWVDERGEIGEPGEEHHENHIVAIVRDPQTGRIGVVDSLANEDAFYFDGETPEDQIQAAAEYVTQVRFRDRDREGRLTNTYPGIRLFVALDEKLAYKRQGGKAYIKGDTPLELAGRIGGAGFELPPELSPRSPEEIGLLATKHPAHGRNQVHTAPRENGNQAA